MNSIKKPQTILLLLLLLTASSTTATQPPAEAKTCPLCGRAFSYVANPTRILYHTTPCHPSYITINTLPVCPHCHFVLFSEKVPEAQWSLCWAAMQSDRYHVGRSSYYLLGILFEYLGKEPLQTAQCYFNASFQERENGEYLHEDLERGLAHLETYLQGEKNRDSFWALAQILKGDLLRRLGRFDEATAHLTQLQIAGNFNSEEDSQNGVLGFFIEEIMHECVRKNSRINYLLDMSHSLIKLDTGGQR